MRDKVPLRVAPPPADPTPAPHHPPWVRLADGRFVRLGRRKPSGRMPRVQLANFFDARSAATPPPAVLDYYSRAAESIKQTLGNTQQGDCVVASAIHQLGLWTGNESGKPLLSSDKEALSLYHQICGPGDNGCIIEEVLEHCRTKGLTVGGKTYKLEAYVTVDWSNKELVKAAMWRFGTLKLGIDLPGAWTCTNCRWDLTDSGVVGGHDVPTIGYNEEGVWIATWGDKCLITWPAFLSKKYIEECWLPLSPEWWANDGLAGAGFKPEQLRIDLAQIGHGAMPSDDPTPPAPPEPPPPPYPPYPFRDLLLRLNDNVFAALKQRTGPVLDFVLTQLHDLIAAEITKLVDFAPAPSGTKEDDEPRP